MNDNLLHFLIGTASVFAALLLMDLFGWLVWGRRENKVDNARQDRLLALQERLVLVAKRSHDEYMEGNIQPSELAYNVAELAEAFSALADELVEV